VTAQAAPAIEGTTANVTISGYLEYINVMCNPVNFTAGNGRQPGREVEKINACDQGYITISMSESTNIAWDVYINASDLISASGYGTNIPPSQMEVWTVGCSLELQPANLDYGLTKICTNIARDSSIDVYFNLTIPIGQYNDTYDGDFWIYVNSTYASPGEGSNRTWYGPDNTTVTIIPYVEFWWNPATIPIDFTALTPGTGFGGTPSANATKPAVGPNGGFPANMTNGDNTNIYIDIYIMGTDLTCNGPPADACWGPPIFNISVGQNGNLTYSNASSDVTWPDAIKFVDYSYQAPPYQGDFVNWNHVPNYTDVSSFWNISIHPDTLQGSYGGDITAKAVDQGEAP